MTTILEIHCRDPIVSRDGRPFGFGQGNRMRSTDWPVPSMVAGSLRSCLGKAAARDFNDPKVTEALLQTAVAGVFPMAEGRLYLPAPRDYTVHPEKGPLPLRPQDIENGGCDWPAPGLKPVMVAEAREVGDLKRKTGPAWWPAERYAHWLAGGRLAFDGRFLNKPGIEERTHAQLDPATGAADEGLLFTTAALSLTYLSRFEPEGTSPRDSERDPGDLGGSQNRHFGAFAVRPSPKRFVEVTLATRIRAEGWCGETAAALDRVHPLGGERRLVHWKAGGSGTDWTCPDNVRAALSTATRVRLALATPAVFGSGWKPAWLDRNLRGTPPGADVLLKLVGVCMQRWQAVSGWSLAPPRGPKPVKRMVPAGGVYFFEVAEGRASSLEGLWLEPVSDKTQDRRDGFGLALWGIW